MVKIRTIFFLFNHWIIRPIQQKINKLLNRKFIKTLKWYVTRRSIPKTNGIFLHLGCGPIDYPGFINFDRYPYPHVHFLKDVQNLKTFKNNSVDLIYISHCLEHFSYLKLPGILKEYYRVLKPNGILRISVPNFKDIVAIYNTEKSLTAIVPPLMGGQEYQYNFHYSVFDEMYLGTLLKEIGFSSVSRWIFGTGPYKDLPDWSGKRLALSDSDKTYEISLNMEGIK